MTELHTLAFAGLAGNDWREYDAGRMRECSTSILYPYNKLHLGLLVHDSLKILSCKNREVSIASQLHCIVDHLATSSIMVKTVLLRARAPSL